MPPPSLLARARGLWQNHKVGLRIEQFYPAVLAVAASIAVFKAPLDATKLEALIKDVLPIAITVATILAGFQATAQSVMIALIESAAWKFLRRIGHDRRLVRYHWVTIRSLLAFIFAALILLILKTVGIDVLRYTSLVPALFGGLFVYAALCSFRITRLMFILLTHKDGPSDDGE